MEGPFLGLTNDRAQLGEPEDVDGGAAGIVEVNHSNKE